MSDNPVAEVTEPATETAEDVAPPVPVVEPPQESAPDWQGPFEELRETVNGLADQLAVIVKPGGEGDITDVIEPDETPTRKPWTHRNPFSR